MRQLLSLLVLTALLACAGCSGAGEKGINKDRDRPRPPEEQKPQ